MPGWLITLLRHLMHLFCLEAGKGLSIQMSVKHGPVTLLSVVEGKEGIFLLVAEGESVPGQPG